MTGKNELYANAFVKDVESLQQFVFEEIYKIDGVVKVEYNIITKNIKVEDYLHKIKF